ncbi:MAG: nitroreductase family protein [Saccharofermentanales bacterium]
MTDLQAIQARKSRRTYLRTPISEEHAAILTSLIGTINSNSGLNVEFVENGSAAFDGLLRNYGLFKEVRSLIVFKGDNDDVFLKEKSGYFGEQIMLEATKLGLGTCWVGGTYHRSSRIFSLGDNEQLVCVVTIGNVEKKLSSREKLIHGLTHRRTRLAAELYEADTTPPQWFLDGIAAVQMAPTAVNSQKFLFSFIDGKVTARVPENSAFDLLDLGIGKLHFEIGAQNGKFELGNYGVYLG